MAARASGHGIPVRRKEKQKKSLAAHGRGGDPGQRHRKYEEIALIRRQSQPAPPRHRVRKIARLTLPARSVGKRLLAESSRVSVLTPLDTAVGRDRSISGRGDRQREGSVPGS